MEQVEKYLAGESDGVRRAVKIVALCISLHGGRDGSGLFVGTSRYASLNGRMRLAAMTSRSVSEFWDRLHRSMLWQLRQMDKSREILSLIAACESDHETLSAIADRTQSVTMAAREVSKGQRVSDQGINSIGSDLPSDPREHDDPLDDVFGVSQ